MQDSNAAANMAANELQLHQRVFYNSKDWFVQMVNALKETHIESLRKHLRISNA